mgnify:CR=1 FL=1
MGSGTRRAKRAARGTAGETAGRFGLAARGALYCVGAILALRLVTGADERVDRDGALDALARQRIGSVLLSLIAAGFAGYAVWRFLRAFTGAREGSDSSTSGVTGAFRRLLDAGKGLIYVGLAYTALRVLIGGRDEVGGGEQERDWTIALLRHSWGRPVVLLAGAGVFAAGVLLAARGLQKDFTKSIDDRRVPTWARRFVPVGGTIGYVARGCVVAIVGWFIAHAAWTFDPQEAVGVAGALGRLSGALYGRVVLSAVALGLAAFGLFSFVEAGYRKVLED